MALEGILFDLDGTLIDFQIDYKRARDKTIEVLEKHGYPRGKLNRNMLVLEMVDSAMEYFQVHLGLEKEDMEEIKKEISNKVAEIEKKAALKASAIQGIHDVLSFLQDNNIKMGILTFNTTENAIISIETAKLKQYFNNIEYYVGRDQVKKPKPHANHAKELMQRMDLEAEEVVLIGDHPRDIECANNIDATSIAIVSEKHESDKFHTPHTIKVDKISSELIPLLEKML